jgi:hypothetical protein
MDNRLLKDLGFVYDRRTAAWHHAKLGMFYRRRLHTDAQFVRNLVNRICPGNYPWTGASAHFQTEKRKQ